MFTEIREEIESPTGTMPNSFAFLMLAVWPLVTLAIFRRTTREKALIWTILGAYLLLPPLPAAFDLPLLPPFNKHTIPLLTIVIILAFNLHKSGISASKILVSPLFLVHPVLFIAFIRRLKAVLVLPDTRLAKILVALFVFSPAATVLTNGEPLIFQLKVLPGLGPIDISALVITQTVLLIGFLLARNILNTEESQRLLLLALMVGGVFYSVPMLVEVMLSPQLNIWIYGYFQAVFEQMIRGGGFRPIVFLNHGIWVAFFIMTSIVSALALWKSNQTNSRKHLLLVVIYLLLVLVLSKTLGPLLFAGILLPVIWLTNRRTQINIAAMIAIVAMSYPILKTVDIVPETQLIEQAARIDVNRAASLQFRFDSEDELFERANLKPFFGWGSWGRNLLHDPITGDITSVADGRWVIVLGAFGWVGFVAEFGLLLYPLLLVWREMRFQTDKKLSPYVGALSLLLCVNLVDLLPNATLTPLTWLIAGSLLGYGETLRRNRLAKTAKMSRQPKPARRRTIM